MWDLALKHHWAKPSAVRSPSDLGRWGCTKIKQVKWFVPRGLPRACKCCQARAGFEVPHLIAPPFACQTAAIIAYSFMTAATYARAIEKDEARLLARGGQQHKYLQQLIKRIGEDKRYKATIEKPVLNGKGKVDVALEKKGRSIAREISVTSTECSRRRKATPAFGAENGVADVSLDPLLSRRGENALAARCDTDSAQNVIGKPCEFRACVNQR